MSDDKWVKLDSSAPTWEYTEEKEFIGVFVEKREHIGPNDSNLYMFENEKDHKLWGVWGSAVLDTRFKNLKVGEEVKIEYKGKTKSEKTGRSFHDFDVWHAKPVMEKIEDDVKTPF